MGCRNKIIFYSILTFPAHGRNLVGDAGDVSPHFFRRGDIICHVPLLFSLRVCMWRGFKTKYDVFTFCVKTFSC